MKHGHNKKGQQSKTYTSWRGMLDRCYNENTPYFINYGGRGVQVVDRWHTFENFLADMGERPEGSTLDRIDNEGDYSPENCRWASWSIQRLNTRPRPTSLTGISGVWLKRGRWEARGKFEGISTRLYYGSDFFEACCARKSWENRHGKTA